MRKFPSAIFGLALLCASQTQAGTATKYGVKPVVQAHYSFCWDEPGGPKVVYFSALMTWAPSLGVPELNQPFRSYLTKTYGAAAGHSLPACRNSLSIDDMVALKKQQDAEYVGRKWKIVETNWAGTGVPGAASSLTTPPAASANAQTSPPPAAQAVTDTAKEQVNGQIKQAGQELFDKLLQH